MSSITLSKTETSLLTEAAGREHGLLVLPRTMKATTAQRLLGKLINDGVVSAREQDGTTSHHLTPAGYRAIGLKPPGQHSTKRSLILDLLARGRGRASTSCSPRPDGCRIRRGRLCPAFARAGRRW